SIHPNEVDETTFMRYLIAVESQSAHPIAQAILAYPLEVPNDQAQQVVEWAGKGLQAVVGGQTVLVGNQKLMEQFQIAIPAAMNAIDETLVLLAVEGQWLGHLIIADELKSDAKASVQQLRKSGIQRLVMLSGDRNGPTQAIAQQLQLDEAYGELLPEDKLSILEQIKKDPRQRVAFLGDGINDAPVLAASDIGISMGGLGADVAIETADLVIQTDQPSKVATAIRIGRSTKQVIQQNIVLAFGVKTLVLLLAAMGWASMWEAVFADVGVALLAILNAVRLQHMQWN
ncbi:MAG: HAD-IC family P-type ATPase, partial [Bacteroidota bacterium]